LDATFDSQREVAPARSRRRRLVLLLATLAAVSLGAGQFSLAIFTDQETVAGTFSTGSIVLDDVKIDALTLTTAALMPGDSVTDDVVVENDGTAQLRYSMSTASTNADLKGLRDVLTLEVRGIDTTVPATPCDVFDGAPVLIPTLLGTNTAKFGDVTAGSQAGDRTINAGANETLCFRVSLPGGTGNPYQSATTTTTFTFDAEQTASNP
jgi:predicted ribosomally synthesized peptide with SipW-like signal peptide